MKIDVTDVTDVTRLILNDLRVTSSSFGDVTRRYRRYRQP
jgi:hypothetical protein